jgi:SPP1 family holin
MKKSTIVRLVLVLLALVNYALEKAGIDIINVSEYEILTGLELIIEVAILVVGVWKNNSVSKKAIKADEFLKELRDSE